MDRAGNLSGLPLELGELFGQAYQGGARIHNNSWSANTKSFYTLQCLEVDQFIHAHPDMLITIAAGNEGNAADPFSAQPGYVDWQSMGSPAASKNALTVGASRSRRTEGGMSAKDYGSFNSSRFPNPPIARQKVSGDPQCMAAFSSRGPCDPLRIKPDLVAPGTDILSARSANAPVANFWGVLEDSDAYAYMGGTSMATPLVSGCGALVREYFRKERGREPSAALLKATLVNSTRRLNGDCAIADHDKLPNYHQGFGALYMPYAIPNAHEAWLKLWFVDTWRGGSSFRPGSSKDRARLAFEVKGGGFLRICLTWTDDAAGASLQNILGLMIEQAGVPTSKRMGNEDRPSPVGRLDRNNNVQIIRITDPAPGMYMVQVFAANLLSEQHWALVITGDVEEPVEI